MNFPTVGNRNWITIICLAIVAGALPLGGCALSRASESKIAARTKPAGTQPAPAEERALPSEPSTAAESRVSPMGETNVSTDSPGSTMHAPPPAVPPVDAAPVAARFWGQLLPPSAPSIRLVGDESYSSANVQTSSPQSPSPPMKIAQAAPKLVSRPAKRTVLHASEATFEQQVLRSDVPVLVDFYASWCGPCKQLAPALEELAQECPQARVVKVNIDDSPVVAARYGVKAVPTLMVFKDGRVRAMQKGVASRTELKAMLDL